MVDIFTKTVEENLTKITILSWGSRINKEKEKQLGLSLAKLSFSSSLCFFCLDFGVKMHLNIHFRSDVGVCVDSCVT